MSDLNWQNMKECEKWELLNKHVRLEKHNPPDVKQMPQWTWIPIRHVCFGSLPPAHHHIITSARMQCSLNTHIIITRWLNSTWNPPNPRKNNNNNNNTAHDCWISGRASQVQHQVIPAVVALWGESLLVSFCSTSCHWECEQQRAAWMHKYKLEGRIHQSSRARAALRLWVSQHAARLPSDSSADHGGPGTVISISSISGPRGGPAAGWGNKGSL